MGDEKAKYLQVFQENLIRERKKLGLSQEETGAKIDMGQSRYSKLEVSDLDLRLSTVHKLSQALNVPMYELLREKQPSNLSDEDLLRRVLEMEGSPRQALFQVIEGFLRNYEATKDVEPESERLKELRKFRKSQD